MPESPNKAVEQVASRGPDLGMEPEREEHERAVALTKAVQTAAANTLSARDGTKL